MRDIVARSGKTCNKKVRKNAEAGCFRGKSAQRAVIPAGPSEKGSTQLTCALPLIGWKAEFDLPAVFLHHAHMVLDPKQKELLKKELVSCLSGDPEIRRIVIFGSFVESSSPDDMDVAVFQDSEEPYLSLAVKYRTQARLVSRRIPLDIISLRSSVMSDPFLKEIEQGETVYER